MSLRFRRSIKIAPGVRLNVTKTGFGVTAGVRGAHYFRDALAKTARRDPGLLNAVRYDRALTFGKVGQRGRAKADLERLYAADPSFEDVKERLVALAAGGSQ